jgi:O-methyltransferase involved in polyketide biosynthesis
MSTVFEDVTDTVSWVAAYRAKESARPDALFRDPLAEHFTDERGRRIADEIVGTENFEWAIVVRTLGSRRADRGRRLWGGGDAQPRCGHGLEALSTRPSLGSSVVRVDHAKVIERKEERVAEGMIGYLNNEEVGELATDLATCEHFSEWVVDYSSRMLRRAMRRGRKVQEHFRMTPPRFDPTDREAFFRSQRAEVRKRLGVSVLEHANRLVESPHN